MRRVLKGSLLFGLISISAAVTADDGPNRLESSLERHWQRPLLTQGEPWASRSSVETSLDPSDCGSCHPRQFEDWRQSLHAKAMGPGLLGQLLVMEPGDRTGQQACMRCHAPLAEQADEIAARLMADAGGRKKATSSASSDRPLHTQGLICAGCHLREGVVFGPPRRDGGKEMAGVPHSGFVIAEAFQDSRFCAACHQFEADGYALNGKLLENTWQEWRASPQAKAGESCQTCHMPDRRHLWRGIHDREMVLSGVSIELDEIATTQGLVTGSLILTNSGTGHRFPTYVTPRVVLEGIQIDRHGEPISETRQAVIVARAVSLDLSVEHFDTRLAPGESARLDYSHKKHPRAVALKIDIRVEPDRFYRDFYLSLQQSGSSMMDRAYLQQALQAAESSEYSIFRRVIPL